MFSQVSCSQMLNVVFRLYMYSVEGNSFFYFQPSFSSLFLHVCLYKLSDDEKWCKKGNFFFVHSYYDLIKIHLFTQIGIFNFWRKSSSHSPEYRFYWSMMLIILIFSFLIFRWNNFWYCWHFASYCWNRRTSRSWWKCWSP